MNYLHPLSLDHLTIAEVSPPELVAVASQVGCSKVSMFLEPYTGVGASYDMVGNKALCRTTRDHCQGLGVTIGSVEPFIIWPDTAVQNFQPLLEVAGYLGAEKINALGFDPELERQKERFAEFCALAAEHGLGMQAEFFTLCALNSLAKAVDLVRSTGRPEVTINIDVLHLMRTGSTASDIRALDPSLIGYLQLSDGPRAPPQDLMFEASKQRQAPGEGEFDLEAILEVVPEGVTVGVEVPSYRLRQQGLLALERARLAVDATRRLLDATN